MKKIISLFQRNYETDRLVRDEIVPGAEWVVNGEGIATVKWDGTACLYRDGVLYKRYDAKEGRTPPKGWEPCQPAPDPVSKHWPGWLAVGDGPEDKAYREALAIGVALGERSWTYELVGPKVQGNLYGLDAHRLFPHGLCPVSEEPQRDFASIKAWFLAHPDVEGIVWWRDVGDVDCDKVKIKRKDFGLPWPQPKG